MDISEGRKKPNPDELSSWFNICISRKRRILSVLGLKKNFYEEIRSTPRPFIIPPTQMIIEEIERNNALVHALVCPYVKDFKLGFDLLDNLPASRRVRIMKKYLFASFSGWVDLDELLGKKLSQKQRYNFHGAMGEVLGIIHKVLLELRKRGNPTVLFLIKWDIIHYENPDTKEAFLRALKCLQEMTKGETRRVFQLLPKIV